MSKKLLIISHDFPPTWHSGVVRIYSLVKQVIDSTKLHLFIVSADDKYNVKVFNDIKPLDNIEYRITLIRTKSFEPESKEFLGKVVGIRKKSRVDKIVFFIIKNFFEPLLIPDRSILWLPHALLSGFRLLKQQQINLILSTAPPFTNLIVAKLLSVFFKKCLVVDFRDDWVGNPFPNKGFIRKNANKLLERWVVRKNTQIITTSPESKNSFIQKYGNLIQERITVVTNGFDDDLYKQILSVKKNKFQQGQNGKVVFLYAGSLTSKRTPEFFFKAIRSLIDGKDITPESIQVNFVGYTPIAHKNLPVNLNGVVNFIDPVNHSLLVEYYVSSDILLLFQRTSEGGNTAIPGKFYEYLCTRKPILLMSDGGATDSILKKLNAGYTTKYELIEDISNTIKMLIGCIKKGEPLNVVNENVLKCFRRTSLNNKIIEVLNKQL